jgi:hypothetical protein
MVGEIAPDGFAGAVDVQGLPRARASAVARAKTSALDEVAAGLLVAPDQRLSSSNAEVAGFSTMMWAPAANESMGQPEVGGRGV